MGGVLPIMSIKHKLNHEYLIFLIDYNIETGIFKRKTDGIKFKSGDIATTSSGHGYLSIWVNGERYLAHRLAWFYVFKVWPSECIDHINCDRKDNRILNLRIATKSQNNQNSKHRINNTSGHKGVTWHKRDKCWRVKCSVNGVNHDVGAYKNLSDAVLAYNAFAQNNHREFYRNDRKTKKTNPLKAY